MVPSGFVLMMQTISMCHILFHRFILYYVTGSSLADITSKAESSFLANLTSGAASKSDNIRHFQVWESHGLVVEWRGVAGSGKEEHLGLQTLPPLQPMVTACSSAWVVGGAGHLANSRGGRSASFNPTSNCLSSW